MKRNDWILITATALYSFLFYKQVAGINFLIFNLVLIISLCLKERQETLNINWWLAAAGSLSTAVCVTLYGNVFSIVINIISLSLLAGLSFSSRSSVILSILYSWYSYFSAVAFIFIDFAQRKAGRNTENTNPYMKRLILVLVPVLITFAFFFIYRSSSALFNDFAQKINFDFISWGWVRFTFFGFIVLYGFFYHRQVRALATLDENASAVIMPGGRQPFTFFGKEVQIDDENFSGTVLFALLNLLLLLVNYLDFNYMFITSKLPEGVIYADFVHQGVGMIIFSVVIAISIVLFCFRGDLNFFKGNKLLKTLAYLWILQNLVMVLLNAYRTGIYSEYTLTYKRIGVFIYLGLTLIGLVTTMIKIAAIKSNNYLFRINGWIFYVVFVALSFFNWEMIITRNNIKHPVDMDICYLIQLSWANLPELITLDNTTTSMFDLGAVRGDCYSMSGNAFSGKLYNFMLDKDESDWRGWSYERARVYSELNDPRYTDKITRLDLSYIKNVKPEVLKQFSKINTLGLAHTNFNTIGSLYFFPELKVLDISDNSIKDIKGIEKLDKLEDINLSGNPDIDYSPLYTLKNLKIIRLDERNNSVNFQEIKERMPDVTIVY